MSINSIFAGSTPHSRDTIRQQYLNNMALDIANMTKNLNANKLFKANGTTGSAPPDTRSATEKFADVEGLRQSVKTGLREITEPIEAENIVAEITTPELEYLAQNLPFIIRDLKPKFALGVPAGSFVPYLRRMLRDNIANEGIAYGLTTAPNVAGGVATTGAEYMDKNEWRDLVGSVQDYPTTGNQGEQNKYSALMAKIDSMAEMTPTHADREMVASLRDPDILDNYDDIVAQIGQKLPFTRDLERALKLPTLAQKNKTLSNLLDGVNLAQLRELQEYLDGVRETLDQQSTEAKLIRSREQQFRESPEDFDERIARENPVGAIPTQQVPEGIYAPRVESRGALPRTLGEDILSQTPRAIGPQRQIATQQDSPDLPSAYINDPDRTDLGYTDLVAPNKGKALSYDDYSQLHYFTKKDMLLAYADAGIFNDMDAGFHQLINAIADGYEVPERAMDNEYRKFDKANSLFKGDIELPDRGDRAGEELYFGDIKKQLETHREPEEESGFGWAMEGEDPVNDPNPPQMGKKAKLNKFMIRERLMRGDYENYPDFKEVAELIVNTDRVEDEDINNFLQAFIKQQMQEEEEGGQMGGEDVNVGRPAEKASFATPLGYIDPSTRLAELSSFKDLTPLKKKGMLQSLRDNGQINDDKLIQRVNTLSDAPQNRTLNALYDDILISRGEVQSLAGLPVSSAKAEKEAPASPKGVASLKSGQTEEEASSVAGTTGTAKKAVPPPPYPTSSSAFVKVQGGNETKRAIIEKAYHEGILDADAIYDEESGKLLAEISDETVSLIKSLFPANYRGGDFIPEDTTAKVLKQAYDGIFNILKYKKLLGTGLGAPHHVLGPNGYGLPHNLTSQGRPNYQTVGGKLPTNKKKGNIIFGMGLARPTQPSPRMGKNVNLAGGIEAEPSYVKFGTHLINKHRLKDNVVMMRTMKGGAIVNIPTQKVSGKLAKVLHCISGGGIPQFESVMDLADEDKALLHRITKTSKVSDRLSVPNPNKTKLEEEDNRFNILRGEVSIGNDAPSVIKEFKVLLLKFMREGRVPTGQGKAIMEELLLMGY